MPEVVYHTIKPVFDENSRVLILGSFPSVVTRKKDFYYANPQNRFWKVMEAIFREEIKDRKDFCHRHHVALWDVIASCSIQGSSDASITDVKVNDIACLLAKTRVHVIFTTGLKAYQLFDKYIRVNVPVIPLPSTSGANAHMSLAELTEKYRIIEKEAETE